MKTEYRWRSGVTALLLAVVLSGCGGWIRSRLPDPNAKAEEQASVAAEPAPQSQPEAPSTGGVGSEAPPVSLEPQSVPISAESPEPIWEMPAEPARELKWRIVRADLKDPTLPEKDESGGLQSFLDGSPWRTLSEGVNSQAMGVIRLGVADSMPPQSWRSGQSPIPPHHLVVGGTIAGKQILDARYELIIEDDANRPIRERVRKLARRDERLGTWFVPISEILGENPASWVTPLHKFTLVWELELENGKTLRVGVTVRFSLPPISLNRRQVRSFVELQSGRIADTRLLERMAHEETWENPSDRVVDLWLRAHSEGLGERHSILRRDPKIKKPLAPDLEWKTSHLRSVATFSLGAVEVEGAQLVGESPSQTEGVWLHLRLNPHARATIRWRAQLTGSDFPSGASLERNEKVVLKWHRVEACPLLVCIGIRFVEEKVKTERTWRQSGAYGSGIVHTQAFVAEPELGVLESDASSLGSVEAFRGFLEQNELGSTLAPFQAGQVDPGLSAGEVWRADRGRPAN